MKVLARRETDTGVWRVVQENDGIYVDGYNLFEARRFYRHVDWGKFEIKEQALLVIELIDMSEWETASDALSKQCLLAATELMRANKRFRHL